MALVGQISWNSLFSDVGRMSVVTKSGVTYAVVFLLLGKLQFDISSQYDKQQEHLLFTPLFKADNARVFDLEVESSTGVAQYADRLFLSATTDGINYGREQMIEQNEPFVYDKRVLWKRVGRIRKNVGFKLRVITKSPVTLSGCQIRIE